MPKDPVDHEDALVALSYKGTVATILNKVRKVAISTEDTKLKSLLAPVISDLEQAFRNQTKAMSVGLNLSDPRYKEIIQYCQYCRQERKPQWQILAEQNGWKPPV